MISQKFHFLSLVFVLVSLISLPQNLSGEEKAVKSDFSESGGLETGQDPVDYRSGDSDQKISTAEAKKRIAPLAEKINARYEEMKNLYGFGNAPKTIRKEFERRGITAKNFLEGTSESWGNNGLFVSFDNCAKYHYEHHRDVLEKSLEIIRSREYAYASELLSLEQGVEEWSEAEEEIKQVYAKKVEFWAGEPAYWGYQAQLVGERKNQFLAGRSPTVPLTSEEQAQIDAFDQEYKQDIEKENAASEAQKGQLDPIVDKYCAHPEFFEVIDQEVTVKVSLD